MGYHLIQLSEHHGINVVGCRMSCLLWKTIWLTFEILNKINNWSIYFFTFSSSECNFFFDSLSKWLKRESQRNFLTTLFIASLFIVAKIQGQTSVLETARKPQQSLFLAPPTSPLPSPSILGWEVHAQLHPTFCKSARDLNPAPHACSARVPSCWTIYLCVSF